MPLGEKTWRWTEHREQYSPRSQKDFLRLNPADNLMEKGREGLGVNHSHLHQGCILTGRCGLISIIFLAVWRFIIRQDHWPDHGWVLQLWKHSTRSSSSLLLLWLRQSPPQLSHTQGHDLKITTFQTFLRNTDCWQRIWGNLNLRWGQKSCEANLKKDLVSPYL